MHSLRMSDSDSGNEEITEEYLQSLLDKAKSNARESANMKKALRENAFGAGEDIIKLDSDESQRCCMIRRTFFIILLSLATDHYLH